MKSRSVHAFSLVEVTLALGLLAFCGLAVLSLLLGGIQQTEAVRDETIALLLARQVRTRLLDPSWPLEREAQAGSWKAEISFDASGVPAAKPMGAFRVELQGGPGLGFRSPRLEAVRARILRQSTEIDSFVLQRRTEALP